MARFELDLPVLRLGATGRHVVTAQMLLLARGHTTPLSGLFDAQTEAATRDMQGRYGAEVIDGIWGRETWTIAITGQDLANPGT